MEGWVKCNTNGISKVPSRQAACGGLFRDYNGDVCGVFVQQLGVESANFAELMAVLLAVELWLIVEVGSVFGSKWTLLSPSLIFSTKVMFLIGRLGGGGKIVFGSWHRWKFGRPNISGRECPSGYPFQCALSIDSFCWWDCDIPEIRRAVYDYSVGKVKYRFC